MKPGQHPVIPASSTEPQIALLAQTHSNDKKIWKEYITTNKALKQQLMATVNKMYYHKLHNCITNFGMVTTFAILEHLYKVYGKITPSNLADNKICMKAPYNPS